MSDPIANRAHDVFPVLVANVRRLWGDGGESLTVFGHHKGSRGKRMTRIVIRVLEFYEGGTSTVAMWTKWADRLNVKAAEVACECPCS